MRRVPLLVFILLVASFATSARGDTFQASGTIGSVWSFQVTATLSGQSVLAVENQPANGPEWSCQQGIPCALSGSAAGWYPEDLIYINGVLDPTVSAWLSWTASHTFPVESSGQDFVFVVPMTTASFELDRGMGVIGIIPGSGTLTLTGYTFGGGWDEITSIAFVSTGSTAPDPPPQPRLPNQRRS
jgi:hypothetical protein